MQLMWNSLLSCVKKYWVLFGFVSACEDCEHDRSDYSLLPSHQHHRYHGDRCFFQLQASECDVKEMFFLFSFFCIWFSVLLAVFFFLNFVVI